MKYTAIAFLLVLITACSKDDTPKDYRAENDAEIQAYIAENNLTVEKSNSGLYYSIDNPGTGDNPTITDRVKVIYKGYYTDGTVFDESTEGASFILQNVILGWVEGIPFFKEGGSGKLLIPSHLAYGSRDVRGIPAGSVLIFDVELVYVNYVTENEAQIQNYIAENNLTAQKSESGLYYTIDEPGTGSQPTQNNNVTVAYKGYLLNGNVFDESDPMGVAFGLQQVIPGWTEGITYFKEGGSGVLLIPARLGYGNNGIPRAGIPGGAVLIFDINLISVN